MTSVHGVHTLGGLVRRPMALWILVPLLWAVAWPLLSLADGGTPVRSIWSGPATAEVRHAVWHLTVLVPAVFGLAVAAARLDLQHALFSWVLPGTRRGLLVGTLLTAVPVALALAAVAGRTMPAQAAAAFAAATLWFAAASTAVDAGVPRVIRWPVVLALVVAALRPAAVADVVERWPEVATVVALGLAGLLLVVQFTRETARTRHFVWSAAAPGRKSLYWAGRRGGDREWRRSLATERLGPWLRAAAYERSTGRAVALPHLAAAAFGVLWGQLTNSPFMILIMAGMVLSTGRLQLATSLPYPLSRARRARLVVAGSAIEGAVLVVLMGLFVLAVQAVDVPVLAWFAEDGPRYGWAPVLAMTWAWSPVAQWPAVFGPLAHGPPFRMQARWAVPFFVYGILGSVWATVLTGRAPAVLAAATLAIAAVLHLTHWTLVRRHYARADLGVASPSRP